VPSAIPDGVNHLTSRRRAKLSRYDYARDRVLEAKRALSEGTAATVLLDAYEADEIEARPSRNVSGRLDVHLYRLKPEALRSTWWHAGDLERLYPIPSSTGRPDHPSLKVGPSDNQGGAPPKWPWEEIAVCFGLWLSEDDGNSKLTPSLLNKKIREIAKKLGSDDEVGADAIRYHRQQWLKGYAKYKQ
jgi:hypothetical protein